MVIQSPLRSGQQVYARGGDLVVLAVVNFGAEVIADGNIHVYAPLRGRAIAGAKGDTGARIFCICMEPQLVSIAGTYRTTETALPPEVLGRPAQVRLVDGERLEADDSPIVRAVQRGEHVDGEELELVFPNGRRAFVLASAAPIRDADGIPIRLVRPTPCLPRSRQSMTTIR